MFKVIDDTVYLLFFLRYVKNKTSKIYDKTKKIQLKL